MNTMTQDLQETITLGEAKQLIATLAAEQSLLLLSAPGVGKSDLVLQTAQEAGLECRSLLGTQLAPEDVSGIPRIVGERSVFCPPRILLPEEPKPFCLFLDELPACSPDIQKAFYSLLLERRLGEHRLAPGTWVVAAGNRVEDRALVRSMSSALVNRVFVLNIRTDVKEWLQWAERAAVRSDVRAFIALVPEALSRPVPTAAVPFSTPRAWASVASALDRVEQTAGTIAPTVRRALTFGRVSAEDAAAYCVSAELGIDGLHPPEHYIRNPGALAGYDVTRRWYVLHRLRIKVQERTLTDIQVPVLNAFLRSLPLEQRFALFVGLVAEWGALGADGELLQSVTELAGAT